MHLDPRPSAPLVRVEDHRIPLSPELDPDRPLWRAARVVLALLVAFAGGLLAGWWVS